MKRKIFILFYILTFAVFCFNLVGVSALEGPLDTFELREESYEKDEKFVYAANANFVSGQAAGLVFGGEDGNHYFVFNVDRFENRVKLMYFSKNDEGNMVADVIKEDWFIGNDKMTDAEKNIVGDKVRNRVSSVNLKIVITPEADAIYAEFFADGIKRFGVDTTITLDERYVGGNLGYNVFNANVNFKDVEIGASDYSYYTEMYRNQYHYSQYKNWNNDPNGLVYYNGYYHLFFQHNPYGKTWDTMYWGHARSRDLVHWEQLPIALFPDENGAAWSGSARVYHKGTNPEMDGWFPNGNGNGLIAFYTRDGERQDQILISSDDEGLTWTKRRVIPQSLVGVGDRRISCRDPKVFPIETGTNIKWGMVISNMEDHTVYFLKSENLLDWSYAGQFNIFRPECVDVVDLVANDGTKHTVLTLEGRQYLVGELKYDNIKGEIYFEKYTALGGMDVRGKTIEEINAGKMDFGPDSYATQSFYIDDSNSDYYGKVVSLSWFSGVPNDHENSAESGAFQAARDPWNGGGFTIPVELGLVKDGDEYLLTQTPITLNNPNYSKDVIVNKTNVTYDTSSENLLKKLLTHQFEIITEINNPNRESIEFKLNIGEDEYTTVGWNETDGYYVDRTNTSTGGINFPQPNYHKKYVSGPTEGSVQSFYILSDNGGIEVFCDDFKIPFYVLTMSSVYSINQELNVSGEVTINELTVNKINSIYRDEKAETDEGILYLSKEEVRLDLTFTNEESVMYYSTLGDLPVWELVSGNGVVSFTENSRGIVIKGLSVGEAVIKVTNGNKAKEIIVNVESGTPESDINFTKDGVILGKWYLTSNGLIGSQWSGDGYILSNELVYDCYYTAQIDLGTGAAAALVLRANEDMSNYIMVNYDRYGRVVKAWTPKKELANIYVGDIDTTNIVLSAKLEGTRLEIILNGQSLKVVELDEEAPTNGYLGLNVCATEAIFKSITIQKSDYTYSLGNFAFKSNVEQYITKISNITMKNAIVDKEFYKINGREIIIDERYFQTLTQTGMYQFEVVGQYSSFIINVDVKKLPTVTFSDQYISENEKLNIFVGNTEITSISINGTVVDAANYQIKNMILTLDGTLFNEGENVLTINDTDVVVHVSSMEVSEVGGANDFNVLYVIIPVATILVVLAGVAVVIFLKKRGK